MNSRSHLTALDGSKARKGFSGNMQSVKKPPKPCILYLSLIIFLEFAVPTLAAEKPNPETGDFGISLTEYEYGYWSPEIRELHLRVKLNTDQFAKDELFIPHTVFVNGSEPLYVYWIVDGVRYDDRSIQNADEKKIDVYIPFAWHGGETNSITLMYKRDKSIGTLAFEAPAPKRGGVWKKSNGGNRMFKVCEEAGLERSNEAVEFDVTIQESVFRDPAKDVRATLMTSAGTYREIPCQVYDSERLFGSTGLWGQASVVRFRATVQLSLKPHEEAIVVLWNCPGESPVSNEPRITMNRACELSVAKSATTDTLVENDFYRIRMCPRSGQMFSWFDKQLSVNFEYTDPRGDFPAHTRPINRTPDMFKEGVLWSHVFDWDPDEYQVRSINGAVFCENTRWGSMPDVPEAETSVRYRFYADRPEVRLESVIRIVEDCRAYALRNHGMVFSADLFTHAAWPLANGKIKSISLKFAMGNDTGSPPVANMPYNTPWMALYNAEEGYGMAMLTTGSALFNDKGQHPNTSRTRSYVSVYRGHLVYVIRAANITYFSGIRSLPTPLHAGTTLYEDMVLFPFGSGKGGEPDFNEIAAMRERILHPLIIEP
ncbi:MAG: hypothetical protein ABFS28_10445 [Bacteroidota bacterium]